MAAWREERALTDCCRCFLYLVNYARIKPEIALKALPIIQEDMHDNNPLVRALALRTMSYIHVREYVEATVPHLKNSVGLSELYSRVFLSCGSNELTSDFSQIWLSRSKRRRFSPFFTRMPKTCSTRVLILRKLPGSSGIPPDD